MDKLEARVRPSHGTVTGAEFSSGEAFCCCGIGPGTSAVRASRAPASTQEGLSEAEEGLGELEAAGLRPQEGPQPPRLPGPNRLAYPAQPKAEHRVA
jgi:hypothetical protein